MPAEDVYVWASFKTAPAFISIALELGGILNLRYYVTYPTGWDATGDTVVFDVNGVSRTVTYDATNADDTGLYFPCPVYAFQMADPITAVYYHSDTEIDRMEDYSVEQNLNSLLEKELDETTRAFVQAAMDFGSYIQPYLANYNSWTLGTDHLAMAAFHKNLSALTSVGDQYAHTVNNWDSTSVDRVMFSLSTYQDNALHVVVVLKGGVTGEITGTVNGQPVTPKRYTAGGLTNAYKLTLSGLPSNALALACPFTLSVDGTKVLSLTASALSYVKIMLANSTDDVEKLALTALYNYALAAQEYKPN